MSPSGRGDRTTYAPQQFNEYIILFEGNTITCILTGVYLVITGTNIYLLRQRKTSNILLLYTMVQLALITLYTAMGLYVTPGQALAIFDITDLESAHRAPDTLSTWPAIAINATFVLNTWISDAFLLYRCYHIIRLQNKYALTLPVLLYLATVGSSFAWLVVNSFPGASLSNHPVQLAGKCYMSLSVAMNISASYLITVRLWMYRRAICDVMGSHRGAFYISYIAMTLESALLYTVFTIITLIVFMLDSPLEFVFFPALGVILAISPSLIVYRIARGISFEVDECTIASIYIASSPDGPHTVRGAHSIHQYVLNGPDPLNIHEVKYEM